MTAFVLRLIAILCMLMDHTAYCLLPEGSMLYSVMRLCGRLAFPIFCFLIVEGFLHTRSVGKYALRLAIFAVISELPFDLAFNGGYFGLYKGGSQNVFITLLFGLLAISFAGKLSEPLMKALGVSERNASNHWLQCLVAAPAMALMCWGAGRLNSDYGWMGVLIICGFYIFKDNRTLAVLVFVIVNFLTLSHMSFYSMQIYASFAAIPLLLYNGESGSKKLKLVFYFFYPVHLIILWLLQSYIAL